MISTKVTMCTLVMPFAKPTFKKVSEMPSAEDRGLVQRGQQVRVDLQPMAAGNTAGGAIEHSEQRQEDRNLQQQRQAGRQRIGVVLLVQLHGLLTELLPVMTMFLLQLAHLGLQQLHVA